MSACGPSQLSDRVGECPLSEVKQTSQIETFMSACDPKRTLGDPAPGHFQRPSLIRYDASSGLGQADETARIYCFTRVDGSHMAALCSRAAADDAGGRIPELAGEQ
jgi:hypothetical protein